MNTLIAGLKSWQTTALAIAALMSLWGNALTLLLDGDMTTNPDWNLIVPGTFLGLVGIIARDSIKRSEDVIAK